MLVILARLTLAKLTHGSGPVIPSFYRVKPLLLISLLIATIQVLTPLPVVLLLPLVALEVLLAPVALVELLLMSLLNVAVLITRLNTALGTLPT
jgi:hypothetical protein